MTTTRERAARELCVLEGIDPDAASLGRDMKVRRCWEARLPAVDAVLDAIREPGEMLGAFMVKCRLDIERGVVPLGGDELAGNPSRWLLPVWRTVIDAIKRGEG